MKNEHIQPHADEAIDSIGGRGIAIFQKLVSVSRSADKTMAGLSQWVLDNQMEVGGLTIHNLAKRTGVSETTVFRFCKMLGLSGYKELRLALAEGRGLALGAQLAGTGTPTDQSSNHEMASTVRRVIDVNSEQLFKTSSLISYDALQQAADLLVGSNHVHLAGFGSSAPVAFDAYQRFLALGLTASAHSDPHILAAVTATVRPGAVFLGISCSGRTRDITDAFETAGRRGFKRIAITSDPKSPIAQISDVVLVSAVRRSPISMDVISTRISQLAIIEMISVALAENYEDASIMHDTKMLDREIAKKQVSPEDK
ncbi:MurR/RpiR family transcriptional regulator [Lentilitoribacter sp. EG35]|jgi:DNA-binding MurR/RpiR family transcriptional regulator|uniref:MurR/RpiR family transcriptional regulator n=1 Tax=Lentilitoribacter sp. EG35 TaxID=3234192 RepID=UPI0034601E26